MFLFVVPGVCWELRVASQQIKEGFLYMYKTVYMCTGPGQAPFSTMLKKRVGLISLQDGAKQWR